MAKYNTRIMREGDVDAVHAIECASFSLPWTRDAFVQEVTENRCARYIVAVDERDTPIAYAGMWLVLNEGHITNVAVAPDLRGQGVGRLVMVALMQLAADTGLTMMTLEVRKSNLAARNLYRTLGFVDVGFRKRYYADNNEDALIMTTENLPEGDCERDPYLIRESL